jgi:hypothetical protein
MIGQMEFNGRRDLCFTSPYGRGGITAIVAMPSTKTTMDQI